MNSDKKVIGVIGLRGFPHVMGGVERHCEQLYPRITKLGYRVVVCRRKNYVNEQTKNQSYENIEFIDIWTPQQQHVEALYHSLVALMLLKFKGIKLVHIHSFGPAIVAPVARLLGFSVVMTYHLPNYFQGKWSTLDRFLLKVAENIACTFSNKIIAVSKTNQKIIKKNTGKDSVVIPNGVNLPSDIKGDLSKYAVTKKKYIFTACRFVPEKGIDILIRAFNNIVTEWKLVVAGAADHESKYSTDIVSLAQKNKNIILTGFISGNELELFYANAGLFVLPSFIEGQPISLLEAMSHGLPVIVSDIDAHREMEIEERCFCKPGDVGLWSEKINECLHNHKFLSSGIHNRKMVAEKYNWDSIADKTSAIYESIITGNTNR